MLEEQEYRRDTSTGQVWEKVAEHGSVLSLKHWEDRAHVREVSYGTWLTWERGSLADLVAKGDADRAAVLGDDAAPTPNQNHPLGEEA